MRRPPFVWCDATRLVPRIPSSAQRFKLAFCLAGSHIYRAHYSAVSYDTLEPTPPARSRQASGRPRGRMKGGAATRPLGLLSDRFPWPQLQRAPEAPETSLRSEEHAYIADPVEDGRVSSWPVPSSHQLRPRRRGHNRVGGVILDQVPVGIERDLDRGVTQPGGQPLQIHLLLDPSRGGRVAQGMEVVFRMEDRIAILTLLPSVAGKAGRYLEGPIFAVQHVGMQSHAPSLFGRVGRVQEVRGASTFEGQRRRVAGMGVVRFLLRIRGGRHARPQRF